MFKCNYKYSATSYQKMILKKKKKKSDQKIKWIITSDYGLWPMALFRQIKRKF